MPVATPSGSSGLGGRWLWIIIIVASAVSRVTSRTVFHSDPTHAPAVQPRLFPGVNDRPWAGGSRQASQAIGSALLYRRAVEKVGRRDLAGALADVSRAIGLDPQAGAAWRCRAYIRDEQGDHEGAIDDATRALDLDPADALALEYRGAARQVKGDLQGALADYGHQIELAPSAMAYTNLAVVQNALGRPTEARTSLGKAIDLDSRNVRAYQFRAKVEDEAGDLQRAFSDLLRATELDPRSAGLHDEFGRLLRELGDLEGADREFSKSIDLDVEGSPAYLDRAYLRFDQGAWQGATVDFQKAFLRQPGERDSISLRLWLLKARDGQRPSANWGLADYFKPRIQNGAADWPSKIASYLIGTKSEVEFLRSMDEPDPKGSVERSCEAYFYIGSVHHLEGDRAGAARFLKMCLETRFPKGREFQSAEAALKQLR